MHPACVFVCVRAHMSVFVLTEGPQLKDAQDKHGLWNLSAISDFLHSVLNI